MYLELYARCEWGHDERHRQAHTEGHVDAPRDTQVGTDTQELRQDQVVDQDDGKETGNQDIDSIHLAPS